MRRGSGSTTIGPGVLALGLVLAAVALVGCSDDGDDDPDVSAYCPAEEALLNAQTALKVESDPEALADQLDEVEERTRTFQEEAPELIEEQADVVAEQTYEVLDEIRDEELSPADASDRLTELFSSQEVAEANQVIALFDERYCEEFEGTIPNVPDPATGLPGVPPAADTPTEGTVEPETTTTTGG